MPTKGMDMHQEMFTLRNIGLDADANVAFVLYGLIVFILDASENRTAYKQ